MAEFGVQATQLSAPSGAGASVVAPVTTSLLDNGVMKSLGGIADIFEKGLQIDAKQKVKQQETAIVSTYAKKLGALNDAATSGQMKPSEVAARQRALHSEYVAGYSQYVDEFDKVRKSFSGGTELGEIEDRNKQEQDLRKSRILDAQKAGFPITVGMSEQTINTMVDAHQTSVRTDEEVRRQIRQSEQERAAGRWNNEVLDRERQENSLSLINRISETNLDASASYARDLAVRMKAGKVSPDEAQMEWTGFATRINAQIQAAAALNPSMAAPYRSLFEDMFKAGSKLLDPQSDVNEVENQIKLIIGKQKLTALTQPNISQGVALTQLFGNSPEVALKFSGSILSAANKMAATPIGSNTPIDPVVGIPEREMAAFDVAKNGINSLRQGKNTNPEFQQGITNTINNSLAQVGEALGRPGVDAKYLKNVADFVASPEYGEYAAKNKLDPAANSAAAKTFQMAYEPQVINGIDKKLQEAFTVNTGLIPNRAATGGELKPTDKTFDRTNLKISFTGSGVAFDLNKQPTDPVERVQAQQTLKTLREAQVGVNKLIHMGAHLEGTTNYAKYWEERKHIILPRMFSKYQGLEIGQVVDGKTYMGGEANDPSNWK